VSVDSLAERLPRLFSGAPGAPFVEQPLEFASLSSDGRIGAEIHRLYSTEQTGEQGPAAAVVRYLPGAVAKPHRHPGYELIYVLSGELEIGEVTYGPDSLLVMPPDSVHAPFSSRGCLALAVWEQPVQPL
jgi:uncharacterized RmlC-like cupin family protein